MKQKCLVLYILFFVCFTTKAAVQPITINEGMWNVLTRIGVETDSIESKVCFMDEVLTGCVAVKNVDIPLTISSPGTYCLVEDISFTAASAITIDAECVTFDLNGHVIDGGGVGANAIVLDEGAQDVLIKNGFIRETADNAITDIVSPTQNKNIIARDIEFRFITASTARAIACDKNPNSINGCLIENCRMFDTGGIQIRGDGMVVRNCMLDYSFDSGTSPIIQLIGSNDQNFRSALIQDCVLTSSFGLSSQGISLVRGAHGQIDRCFVSGTSTWGIRFSGVQNIRCSDCTVLGVRTDDGIEISDNEGSNIPMRSGRIERCIANDCSLRGFFIFAGTADGISNLHFVDCLATGPDSSEGFYIRNIDSSNVTTIENVSFTRCLALGVGEGFLIDSNASNVTLNVNFDECVASGGTSNGFSFDGAGGTLDNVAVRGCVAQENAFNGFIVAGSSSNYIFQDCIAQKNTLDGFDFKSSTSLIKVIDCCAHENGGFGFLNEASGAANRFMGNVAFDNSSGDYSGVSTFDSSHIVSFSNPSALIGASRWVNVSS